MESHLSRVRGLKRRRESDGEEDGEEGEVTVVEVADTEGEGEDTAVEGEVAGEEGEEVGVEGEITGVEEEDYGSRRGSDVSRIGTRS